MIKNFILINATLWHYLFAFVLMNQSKLAHRHFMVLVFFNDSVVKFVPVLINIQRNKLVTVLLIFGESSIALHLMHAVGYH